MTGTYNSALVGLSVLIAMCASYVALDLAGRVTAAEGRLRRVWLAGGAGAMGLGIWSMHYIGMLVFTLPVPILYDLPTVLASLVAAVVASGTALFVVSRPRLTLVSTIAGFLRLDGEAVDRDQVQRRIALGHLVIWSLGHLVIWSLGHLVIWSFRPHDELTKCPNDQ